MNTISPGEWLQLAITICGFVAIFATLRVTVKYHGERLDEVDEQIADIAKAMEAISRQDERLKALENRWFNEQFNRQMQQRSTQTPFGQGPLQGG